MAPVQDLDAGPRTSSQIADDFVGDAPDAPRRRLEFLADVSSLLAESLDYEVTLTQLAHFAVPRFADWCAIDVVEKAGDVIRSVVRANADSEEFKRVKAEAERIKLTPHDGPSQPWGIPEVVRTWQSTCATEMTDSLLLAMSRGNPEHLAFLRQLGMSSVMLVPMMARGRKLGVITFVSARSGRHYRSTDLALAEEVARRAALSVDNARLYHEAEEARKRAESANRAKDEFVATISHELRNPLNAMLGWAHLLRTGELDEATRARAIESIERNARSQARLIEDLIDASRIITGKMSLMLRAVELPAVVQAALDAVRPTAKARGIQLDALIDLDEGQVSGDPDRLQQIVWNLLSNAIKFTEPGGQVVLKLLRGAAGLLIQVSDTGRGISPDFLPVIFDRFTQADGSSTRAHGGLGLGLAIVRHLVELHGGKVRAESAGPGQGATFTVELPIPAVRLDSIHRDRGQPPLSSESAAALAYPRASVAGLRVLVVDDQPDARELLGLVLERAGAKVVAVSSVAEALAAVEQAPPDVLVSDIAMPGQDGYELIVRIRSLVPEGRGPIPALALTAYARLEDRLRALGAGYQMHLPKPIVPDDLLGAIAGLATQAHPHPACAR